MKNPVTVVGISMVIAVAAISKFSWDWWLHNAYPVSYFAGDATVVPSEVREGTDYVKYLQFNFYKAGTYHIRIVVTRGDAARVHKVGDVICDNDMVIGPRNIEKDLIWGGTTHMGKISITLSSGSASESHTIDMEDALCQPLTSGELRTVNF